MTTVEDRERLAGSRAAEVFDSNLGRNRFLPNPYYFIFCHLYSSPDFTALLALVMWLRIAGSMLSG
jgi:hypothetical protein